MGRLKILVFVASLICNVGFSFSQNECKRIARLHVDNPSENEPGEVPASFEGGIEALNAYVEEHFSISKDSSALKTHGKIIVQFYVTDEGMLENFTIAKSLHPLLDRKLVTVLKHSPKWTPATLLDKPVRSSYTYCFEP